jgi:hypothetical protein
LSNLPGNVGSTSTNGNLAVRVVGQVSTITIVYSAGPESGATQHIGIFNPFWCP